MILQNKNINGISNIYMITLHSLTILYDKSLVLHLFNFNCSSLDTNHLIKSLFNGFYLCIYVNDIKSINKYSIQKKEIVRRIF